MPMSYYSTVFERSASEVWSLVRDFGAYRLWVDGIDEAYVEDGRPGNAVGGVRHVRMGDTVVRQRLLAHSDVDRSYSYEFREPYRYPTVTDFRATLRVTPVVDGDRAFVEWWTTFDCPPEERERWRAQFADSFATWLGSLRRRL